MADKHEQKAQGQRRQRSTGDGKPPSDDIVQDFVGNLQEQIAHVLRPLMEQASEQAALSIRQRPIQTPQRQGRAPQGETQPAQGRPQEEVGHVLEANQTPEDRQRERPGADVEEVPKVEEEVPKPKESQHTAAYAQVMTTVAQPGLVLDVDDTIKLWQEQLMDVFKDADGFRGVLVLGNAGSSTGVTITLWDSEQAALASRTLERVVRSIEDSVLGAPKIEGYRVIFSR